MPVGITSYGAYVPRYRIRSEEIARIWGDDANVGRGLNVHKKSVPGLDEDVATISVTAARQAMRRAPTPDYEFACKAGTAAIQTGMGLVQSGMCKTVLAIGSDTSQGAPRNALEYSASAGGAALLVGGDKRHILAEIHHTASYTSDTPD